MNIQAFNQVGFIEFALDNLNKCKNKIKDRVLFF